MKNYEIKQIENLKSDQETYTIRWNLTSLCNYYCDFCVQGDRSIHLKNSQGESEEIRKRICKKLIELIETKLNGKYRRLRIFLIGGEVAILPDFKDILIDLATCQFDGDIRFQITTNLSASKEKLLEITNVFKGLKHKKYTRLLNISTSFYKDFTTEEEFMEKIRCIRNRHKKVNKLIMRQKNYRKNKIKDKFVFFFIKVLERKNHNIYLNIGYPLVEDNDYEAYLQFKRRNLKYVDEINYIVIRNYKKSISKALGSKLQQNDIKEVKLTTNKNQVLYFRKHSDISLAVEGGFSPKGMYCDAGVSGISINSLGVVSRCVSSKTSTIGNIIEDTFSLPESGFIFSNQTCFFNYYGVIKKNENNCL